MPEKKNYKIPNILNLFLVVHIFLWFSYDKCIFEVVYVHYYTMGTISFFMIAIVSRWPSISTYEIVITANESLKDIFLLYLYLNSKRCQVAKVAVYFKLYLFYYLLYSIEKLNETGPAPYSFLCYVNSMLLKRTLLTSHLSTQTHKHFTLSNVATLKWKVLVQSGWYTLRL